MPWEEAADEVLRGDGPAGRAGEGVRRRGWRSSPPIRCATDVSFVHCVRDAIDLARMADIGVVVDFYSAWYERGLDELVRENIDLVALVQIDDYRLGTFDMPNRCAIGDGDIPVERLMGTGARRRIRGTVRPGDPRSEDRGGGLSGPDRSQRRAGHAEMLERLGA